MIHLDTNFLIALENPKSAAAAMFGDWLAHAERVNISALVWTEYRCGPLSVEKLDAAAVLFPAPEPYLPTDATLAARLFNRAGRRRGTLMDCMIAAVALRCQAPLATLDTAHFAPLSSQGLTILDAR